MSRQIFLLLALGVIQNSAALPSNITSFLDHYQRDITLLTIGKKSLLCGIEIAQQYNNACVVMVKQEAQIVEQAQSNYCVLSFTPNLRLLQLLGECEHFDVIFFDEQDQTKETIAELAKMSDYIVAIAPTDATHGDTQLYRVVCPGSNESEVNYRILESLAPKVLQRRSLVWPPPTPRKFRPKTYIILSNFSQKKLKKFINAEPDKISITDWAKGINLLSFLFFNGVFPSRDTLLKKVEGMCNDYKFNWHNDLSPANLIVDGANLKCIDFEKKPYEDRHGLERKIRFIKRTISFNPQLNIEHLRKFYWDPVNMRTIFYHTDYY